MPIAKEPLLIGFTIAAPVGGYVTKEAVEKYGWKDKVDDGPDIFTADKADDPDAGKSAPGAPSTRKAKGSQE